VAPETKEVLVRFLPRLVLCAALLLALASPVSVSADDFMFGVRGGYYFEVDEPFLGAELLVGVGHRVYFNPNFEYVFTDNRDYMTFNFDLHYDFPTDGRTFVWAGAGLGLVRIDPENRQETDTEAAANLLLGAGLGRGNVIPYIQAKLILKDNTEFALGFGLRF
jgi:hypothetical protein